MSFDICLGGVGNAFSTEHYGTHLLVDHPDFVLGVDCPDGYRRALKENAFRPSSAGDDPGSGSDDERLTADDLDGLFITHLHGDHVNGLEMTLAYRRYVTQKPLELYGPPTLRDVLWERRLGASLGQSYDGDQYNSLGPDDFYDLRILPWRDAVELGPLTLELYKTTHHLPAAAMRISDGDATLGFSSDTIFDRELINWLNDADLILHEVGPGPGHTPMDDLVALPDAVTDKMQLVHYPDSLIGADSPIPLAREGSRLTVE